MPHSVVAADTEYFQAAIGVLHRTYPIGSEVTSENMPVAPGTTQALPDIGDKDGYPSEPGTVPGARHSS
jgi:hypothetical protein